MTYAASAQDGGVGNGVQLPEDHFRECAACQEISHRTGRLCREGERLLAEYRAQLDTELSRREEHARLIDRR